MKNKITKKDKAYIFKLLETIHYHDNGKTPPHGISFEVATEELVEWGFIHSEDQWTRLALWYFEKNEIPWFDF